MKIISQEICAIYTAVAVEYSKIRWLLPISHVLRF